MSDLISDLAGEIGRTRIKAPDTFADDILHRLESDREGGLRTMTRSSRVLIFSAIVVVYCSLGVLLGIQGYKDYKPAESSSSESSLYEFMDAHHLNTGSLTDPLFSHLNPSN